MREARSSAAVMTGADMCGNSIHSGVKPENYLAMLKAIREFGRYPLELGQ